MSLRVLNAALAAVSAQVALRTGRRLAVFDQLVVLAVGTRGCFDPQKHSSKCVSMRTGRRSLQLAMIDTSLPPPDVELFGVGAAFFAHGFPWAGLGM